MIMVTFFFSFLFFKSIYYIKFIYFQKNIKEYNTPPTISTSSVLYLVKLAPPQTSIAITNLTPSKFPCERLFSPTILCLQHTDITATINNYCSFPSPPAFDDLAFPILPFKLPLATPLFRTRRRWSAYLLLS